jgi:hypothetical protein
MRHSIRRRAYLIVGALVLGMSAYAAAQPMSDLTFHDSGTMENDGEAVIVHGHAHCATYRGEWHLSLNLRQDDGAIKADNTIGPHQCDNDGTNDWHARLESNGSGAFHPGDANLAGTLTVRESGTRTTHRFRAATINLHHHDPQGP